MKEIIPILCMIATVIASPLSAKDRQSADQLSEADTSADNGARLSVPERERTKQLRERFKNLPPEQRREMANRFGQWQKLTPQEQARIQKNYQHWQSLPPEARHQLQKLHQRLQTMTPKQRERILQNLKHWRAMTPEDREKIREKARGKTNWSQ